MKNLISTKVLTILLIVIVAFLALSELSLQGKRKKHFVKKTRKNKNNVNNDDTNDTNDDNNSYVSDDSDDSNKTDDSDDSAKFFPNKIDFLQISDIKIKELEQSVKNCKFSKDSKLEECLKHKIDYFKKVINEFNINLNLCKNNFASCKHKYSEI